MQNMGILCYINVFLYVIHNNSQDFIFHFVSCNEGDDVFRKR